MEIKVNDYHITVYEGDWVIIKNDGTPEIVQKAFDVTPPKVEHLVTSAVQGGPVKVGDVVTEISEDEYNLRKSGMTIKDVARHKDVQRLNDRIDDLECHVANLQVQSHDPVAVVCSMGEIPSRYQHLPLLNEMFEFEDAHKLGLFGPIVVYDVYLKRNRMVNVGDK